MRYFSSQQRSVLLALILLSACAASGVSGPGADDPPADASLGSDRGGAAGAYLAGRFAEEQGDLQRAADAFLRALALDPRDPEVRQQALLATLLAGRPEAVRLAREDQSGVAAQLLLAGQDAKAGRWNQAEQRFAKLPRQGFTQPLQPLLVAWAQFGGGHTDAALATLRPFLDGDPGQRAIYAFQAGLIADLAGRTAEAGRLYRLAQEGFRLPFLDLSRAVASWQARNGNLAEARQTLAALAQSGTNLAIAVPRLQGDPSIRPVQRATDGLAESYLMLAAVLRQQDANDFAAVLLRLALDLRPDLTMARLLASEVLGVGKEVSASLTVLAPVREADPLWPLVELRRAELQDRAGNTDEALQILTRLENAYPGRPEPWAEHGAILREKHRWAEAVQAYDRAIALIAVPARSNWTLFYERGIAEERSHQWPKAEADFQRALQLSPDEPYVLNYLGYSWTEQGRNLARAQEMIDRAAAARPNDGAIIDSKGWIELRQGKIASAVSDLEKAVELQPEDSTINSHLGDAYWAAGRKLEALYQWQRALSLNPEPDDVTRLRAKVHEAEAAQQPRQGALAATGPGADGIGKAQP